MREILELRREINALKQRVQALEEGNKPAKRTAKAAEPAKKETPLPAATPASPLDTWNRQP